MPDRFIELPYQFLTLEGQDAEKFLQGQTSCDVSKLTLDKASYGTVNTPKGRMYGLFMIVKTDAGFLLRVHESIIENMQAQLAKYKVFFKCELAVDNRLHAYGLIPEESDDLAGFTCISADQQFKIKMPGRNASYELWSATPPNGEQEALAVWNGIQTQNGIPELYAETVDTFILQYLNLQELGAVSFNKGCYTGQEIIARMKFLGKLKKKTFLLSCPGEVTAIPGTSIFDSDGKKCGEVVRSSWHASQGSLALGILDVSFAEDPKPVFLNGDLVHPFTAEEIVYN